MALTFKQKPQGPKQHIQSVNDVLTFGKHNGVTVEDILHDEPGYFDWLFEKKIITATPEMTELINNAILEHMDTVDIGEYPDWEEIPYNNKERRTMTQEFKIEGYTLTVIPDRGFYLVDSAGCVVVDASVLNSNWPVEIQCTGREFYIKTDTSVQEVSFGISQRTQ